MAPPIINNDAVQGEAFLPGQIFLFGGFALRANSLGLLEQIETAITQEDPKGFTWHKH